MLKSPRCGLGLGQIGSGEVVLIPISVHRAVSSKSFKLVTTYMICVYIHYQLFEVLTKHFQTEMESDLCLAIRMLLYL
jgi:hypothetical protein